MPSAFTLETWFKWTGGGTSTTTGTGGIPDAIPLIAKGSQQADGSNVDINYFLGIDASSGQLVADFEEGAAGTSPGLNHPITGTTRDHHERLAPRRRHLQTAPPGTCTSTAPTSARWP